MKCVICRHGDLRPGSATVTLVRKASTVVVRSVPADVCQNCGEQYVDPEIAKGLLQVAEEASRSGVLVDVREYVAA
jgi:YgiT-type zinc finger domain-containing protein